jgi:hypothetical protein
MIAIREYRETDCERMLSLIRELHAREVALYDRMKPTADMGQRYIDLLRKQCAEDDGVILIAEEDGKALAGRDELRITVHARNEAHTGTYRSFGFDDHLIKMRKALK